MVHALAGVVVVVVRRRDRPACALVAADRPILQVVVSAVDKAHIVVAAVAIEAAVLLHLCARIRARVVRAKVLQNLAR